MINIQGNDIESVGGVRPPSMRKFLEFTFRKDFIGLKINVRTFIVLVSDDVDREEAERFRKAFGNTVKFKYVT